MLLLRQPTFLQIRSSVLVCALLVSVLGATSDPSQSFASIVADLVSRNESCADIGKRNCPDPVNFVHSILNGTVAFEQNPSSTSIHTIPTSKLPEQCSQFVSPANTSVGSTRVYASNQQKQTAAAVESRDSHTYLILAIPPYWGSSAIEGLMSTSPHVSTMCSAGTWQCEGQPLLHQKDRWKVNDTDWDWAFEIYKRKAWNMSKHFLMDKSPPDIAKIEELVHYFEQKRWNYYFITMGRHPCYYHRYKHPDYFKVAHILLKNMHFIPPERHVHILYEQAMLNPRQTAQKLVDAIPELEFLDFDANGMWDPKRDAGGAEDNVLSRGRINETRKKHSTALEKGRRERSKSLLAFAHSKECIISRTAPCYDPIFTRKLGYSKAAFSAQQVKYGGKSNAYFP